MISATPNHDRLSDTPLEQPGQPFFEHLAERMDRHHQAFKRRSPDYYSEVYEFGRGTSDAHQYKARPFSDWHSLMDSQFLGHVLRNSSPCAIAVNENLTSYVVGDGITYTVKAKPKYRNDSATTAQVEQDQEDIDQFHEDYCWPEVQEEAFRDRLITTGDLFAEFDQVRGELDWGFVDSHEIRPPKNNRAINADMNQRFGITFRNGNVRFPTTYHRDGTTDVPASRMAHVKLGGDSRDPRGWPLFLAGYCDAREVDELDYAAGRSAIGYSQNTVVREYDEESEADLMQIAAAIERDQSEAIDDSYVPAAGNTGLIRGGTIHGLAAQWSSRGFIELMDAKIRIYGNIGSVPEFISTGKADIGNRATLISSESPLTRRVRRMAMRVVKFDMRLIYALLAIRAGVFGTDRYDAWLRDHKRRISIKPSIMTPDGRDKGEKQRLSLDEVREGYKSPEDHMREFGTSGADVIEGRKRWAEMEGELRDDLRDSARLNDMLTASELSERIRAAGDLIAIGYTEDEALARAGIDAIEDRTALEEAIEQRQAMLALAANADPNDDPEVLPTGQPS